MGLFFIVLNFEILEFGIWYLVFGIFQSFHHFAQNPQNTANYSGA